MTKVDRILTGEEKNFCMRCNYLSYEYGEVEPENLNFVDSEGIPEGEAQVVCPKCGSISYMIASEEEEKKYDKR